MKTYLITYHTWRSEQRLAIHSTDATDPTTDFKTAAAKYINASHIVPVSAVEIEPEQMVRVPVIITAMGNVFFVKILIEGLLHRTNLVNVLPDDVAEFVRSNGGEARYTVECNIATGWYRRYENWLSDQVTD